MTEFVIIRHGETEYNKKKLVQGLMDNPLNEEGKKQAEATALKLKPEKPYDLILSSPLIRARMTTSIIKNVLNIPSEIIICPEFIERDFGIFEGLPVKETIEKITAEGFFSNDYENDQAIKKRVYDASLKLESIYPSKRLLIISHSHAIKALLASIDPVKYNFLFLLKNASISKFCIKHGIISIKELNL